MRRDGPFISATNTMMCSQCVDMLAKLRLSIRQVPSPHNAVSTMMCSQCVETPAVLPQFIRQVLSLPNATTTQATTNRICNQCAQCWPHIHNSFAWRYRFSWTRLPRRICNRKLHPGKQNGGCEISQAYKRIVQGDVKTWNNDVCTRRRHAREDKDLMARG